RACKGVGTGTGFMWRRSSVRAGILALCMSRSAGDHKKKRSFAAGATGPQDEPTDHPRPKDEGQEETGRDRIVPIKQPLLQLGDPAIRSAEGPRPVETEPKPKEDQRHTNSRRHGQGAAPPPIEIEAHSAIVRSDRIQLQTPMNIEQD